MEQVFVFIRWIIKWFQNNIIPSLFQSYFIAGSQIHSHNTRNATTLRSTNARTNSRVFSIKFYGPNLWNTIPLDIRLAPNIYLFKIRFKAYLITSSDWPPGGGGSPRMASLFLFLSFPLLVSSLLTSFFSPYFPFLISPLSRSILFQFFFSSFRVSSTSSFYLFSSKDLS